jgi:hypothetical protein
MLRVWPQTSATPSKIVGKSRTDTPFAHQVLQHALHAAHLNLARNDIANQLLMILIAISSNSLCVSL